MEVVTSPYWPMPFKAYSVGPTLYFGVLITCILDGCRAMGGRVQRQRAL